MKAYEAKDYEIKGVHIFIGIIFVIFFILAFAVNILITKSTEGLSVSQWMPSKENCSSLIKPPAPVLPPYSKDTVIACNTPGDRRLRLKNCDFYRTFSDEKLCSGCGGCSSCKSKPVIYEQNPCFQTKLSEENLTTVKLPPIYDLEPVSQTTVKKIKPNEIENALENGDLIIAAKNMKMIEYMVQKLKYPGGNGYPSFYEVDGPVTVLTKDGGNYYYMIDYPIKYTPKNIDRYVNSSVYKNYAMDAWRAGSRLQESCNPVVIFKNGKATKNSPASPKVVKGECCKSVWGVPYGCGNWTLLS